MSARTLTFAAVAMAAVLALVILFPMAGQLVGDWSRRDVELRSALVFNTMRDTLAARLSDNTIDRISLLFDSVAQDERVLAIGFCDDKGALLHPTELMPSSLVCAKMSRGEAESFSTLAADGRQLLIGTFPISTQAAKGHFVIVHDLAFAERRGATVRSLAVAVIAISVFVIGGLAAAASFLMMRRWTERWRHALLSASPNDYPRARFPLDREIQQLLQQLDSAREALDHENTRWDMETLRRAASAELPGLQAIVVANREPYIHNHGPAGIELQTPASGVVAALEPVMRACGGTWIAHGSGSADRETVDRHDRVAVPPADPHYKLRRVWLSDDEQDGYYYGLSNEGLWPLCHMAFNRPVFRREDWVQYEAINRRFADAVVEEATTDEPVVLVQDYHFALVPRLLRERLPDATIVTFWHIPWPSADAFGICPWKAEILDGLLGSSILGFHTQSHCNNFIESIDRFVESRIDRERATVSLAGHETLIRPYPISIEWPPAGLSGQKSIASCRENVRRRLKLPSETRLVIGVERFDYTKGILDRMRGVDAFLDSHPQWRGRFLLVQIAAPTRSKLPSYAALQSEAERLAQEINAKHACNGVQPINLIARHHEPHEVFEYFRAADACVISSLHDGMNLVAKEFVAARDDECGVLLLSHFAGASRELPEALLINPYDPQDFSDAFAKALAMPASEQRERMKLMRAIVRSRNVYRWAGQMLLDASLLRKRRKIEDLAKPFSQWSPQAVGEPNRPLVGFASARRASIHGL